VYRIGVKLVHRIGVKLRLVFWRGANRFLSKRVLFCDGTLFVFAGPTSFPGKYLGKLLFRRDVHAQALAPEVKIVCREA